MMSNKVKKIKATQRCANCGEPIYDRYLLLALDQYWHVNCLKCSCCNARLDEIGQTCFTKGGMILCKNDYLRLYGASGTCAVCAKLIPATEMVLRVSDKVYHVSCFTCATCNSPLVTGDRFHYVNGQVFCERDHPAKFFNDTYSETRRYGKKQTAKT